MDDFDPADHTVDEVLAHLATADHVEAQRVLDAERAGKARKGILTPKVEASTAVRSNVQPGVDLETGERDVEHGYDSVAAAVEERAERYEELGDDEAAERVREQFAATTDDTED